MSSLFYPPNNSRMRPKKTIQANFENLTLLDARQDITQKNGYFIYVQVTKELEEFLRNISEYANDVFSRYDNVTAGLSVYSPKEGETLRLHLPYRYNRIELEASCLSSPMFTPYDLFELRFPANIIEMTLQLRTVYYFVNELSEDKCGMSLECKSICIK